MTCGAVGHLYTIQRIHNFTCTRRRKKTARDRNINKMQKQEAREDERRGDKKTEEVGEGKQEQREETENHEREGIREEEKACTPLMALNHVSRLCRDVKESIEFYTKVLGFVLIERPQVLDFEGAWLFNYGIGIHLVQSKDEDRLPSDAEHLDPQDNHISFQV